MGNVPSVSVLLPCFNAGDTLDDAIRSLAGQTYSDFEIIAVDDGSQDATLEILQAWARKDRRIRILKQTHQGIIPALNTGLRACRAALIARMDSDDRSHPERLARQVAYLSSHPEAAVLACQVAAFPAGQVRQGFKIYIDWQNSLLSNEDIRREIFIESPLAHPSVIIRREWLERAGGYQEHGWAEDYDLWLRLYLSGAHFAKIPEVLLEWREHPERLTRCDSRYSLENFLRAKAYYLAHGPLAGRESVILWGAGMMGRRLSKHLLHLKVPLRAFVDIDPRKIGRTRRGLSILSPDELPALWKGSPNPVVLAAVGARGARQLIRQRLDSIGLCEGKDWWGVA
jgi:glycosyltransferase involved in cell wall biosynthesis